MKSRFTQDEIRQIVQESRAEGVTIAAHKHGISEQTVYNWRKRLGITDVTSRIGELKRLQQENARLKRLVAERDLDIDLMKENAGNNVARVTPRLEAGANASWQDVQHGKEYAGFYDELGVENKA